MSPDPVSPLPASSDDAKTFGEALKSTLVELADSKKFVVTATLGIAAVLTLVAGKAHLAWLDEDTAKWIAGVVVAKGIAYLAAQAHVDRAKETTANLPSTLVVPVSSR